ncbi:hypothetical protein ACR42D_10000 [Desulfovibrio caledoniensis]
MWALRRYSSRKAAQEAYRRVFNSDEGRRVLADMAERYCLTRPLCGEGISDRQMMINEGKRQVALEILDLINLDPNDLPKEYTHG